MMLCRLKSVRVCVCVCVCVCVYEIFTQTHNIYNVYQDGTHTHNPKKKLNLLGVSTSPEKRGGK